MQAVGIPVDGSVGKSHSGIEIVAGIHPIFVKSAKQHCVSRSCSEAELIAAIWKESKRYSQSFR